MLVPKATDIMQLSMQRLKMLYNLKSVLSMCASNCSAMYSIIHNVNQLQPIYRHSIIIIQIAFMNNIASIQRDLEIKRRRVVKGISSI